MQQRVEQPSIETTGITRKRPWTPSSTKRAGNTPAALKRTGWLSTAELSPSTVPEPPLTDGRAKKTPDGRLDRAAHFAARIGQPAQSTLLTNLHTKGPDLNSAALSTPANTKETNTTTGDHHVEHNSRRRTVHRRKHRGRTEEQFLKATARTETSPVRQRNTAATSKYHTISNWASHGRADIEAGQPSTPDSPSGTKNWSPSTADRTPTGTANWTGHSRS